MTNFILECVDWVTVNAAVTKQQKVRHQYAPVISLYRWWARRPHALIGALLNASCEAFKSENIHISDPFSGGGTVAFEAASRNLSVYAQDLYPWPTFCLATGLSKPPVSEMKEACNHLMESLEPLRQLFRRCDGRELSHVLRVRIGKCPSCAQQVFLFPNLLFSVASRRKGESGAFFGCRACGHVQRGNQNQRRFICQKCDYTNNGDRKSYFVVCPHCSAENMQMSYCEGMNDWKAVLVQEPIEKNGRLQAMLREVEPADPTSFTYATAEMPELGLPIQDGIETRRLLNAGFRYWGDLYTSRQAVIIRDALKTIMEMNISDSCRDRMALAVIGAGEMPAFLSRWDRFHAKAYEGVANHRYAHTTLAVETNLIATMGRGTLLNRLKSAMKALDWAHKSIPDRVVPVQLISRHERNKAEQQRVRIATGDSRMQGLKSGSVDVVLTDPPYFDDVQYGELARLFHFWLAQYRDLGKVEELREAVPNAQRGNGADFYEIAIADVLRESARTLGDSGRLILTFHNRSMRAWKALARALITGGFAISALAVARAENCADLTKRNGRGMLHDLVLECSKRKDRVLSKARIVFAGESDEERSILAIGQALEKVVRKATPEDLESCYMEHQREFNVKRGFIRCGGKRSEATPRVQKQSATGY